MLLAVAFNYYEKRWQGIKDFFGHPQGFSFNPLAIAAALLLPFFLMILSIRIDTGEWISPDYNMMLGKLPILLILMTGEEYGWRRFAFARLSKNLSFMLAALITSAVWWLWHFPGYVIGIGTPEQLSFLWFGAMLLPASILICFLYLWTRNVYLVILAHVSSNMAFNTLPFLPEVTGDSTAFIIYSGILWLLALPIALNKKYWR
jgi:membrane protease YdiL (CAAX protease family)